MTTPVDMKPLASGAKSHLEALLELNRKTTDEMVRGVRDRYLDHEGAVQLAERLGVEKPRIKRRIYVYFPVVQVYSMPVEAYDEEEALALAQESHVVNEGYGTVHHGRVSRFDRENGPVRAVVGQLSTERMTSAVAADLVGAGDLQRERLALLAEPNADTYSVDDQMRRRMDAELAELARRRESGTATRPIF